MTSPPVFTARQEYYAGEAEDEAEIVSLNPLEPTILEFKFYARDVGPVLAIAVSGGTDREELVSYTRGRS